ncbi:uncharacterized protein LOC109825994 isoform X1 [Asparagus officinalis]|uniref:uncharacterized protein LOC109825994 isoform X1 n=1 Tax=Asparagus officinalis TaxID=4686 RepID=UPI00098E31EB|nr:uncharacterized protein LOC109825994 isoform X1 [Asparagus officinalis]
MISGRMRCGIPFFQRILRMAEAAQSLENPSAVKRQLLPPQTSQLARHSHLTLGAFQRYSSSSTSREPNDKESNQSQDSNNESTKTNNETAAPEQTEVAGYSSESKQPEPQSTKKRRSTKRTKFSDSDTEPDLSADDLVKVVAEKEEQLKLKHKEIEKMQDKVFRSYAEIENVLDRTKREAENTKKFSIQNFAKSLLDVADNLGRASSVVKDSFSKIDSSKDTVGAVPLLKTLLEGVEMTEKQLGEVFRKFGVEKFDPVNEQFDPNRHHAVFQIPDASKPPGSVAAVLKPGYMIYDRVLRPAEVGVTDATNE